MEPVFLEEGGVRQAVLIRDEAFAQHTLLRHGAVQLPRAPRTFLEVKGYLADGMIEGIVWHHPDGRMVKIKAKDFGIKRARPNA